MKIDSYKTNYNKPEFSMLLILFVSYHTYFEQTKNIWSKSCIQHTYKNRGLN